MPCFCAAPAEQARGRFAVGLGAVMPPPPALRMVAAFPALAAGSRADLRMEAAMSSMTLPDIALGGGGLSQFAMSVSLMGGTFALTDLPKLDFQMQRSASSFAANVWPRLGWLTTLRLTSLLNLGLAARLALDLRAMGLDPFEMGGGGPPAPPALPSMAFRLSGPQLARARLLAGLPALPPMMAALNLPPLGEAGALPALSNQLGLLAGLSPPALAIPMPLILRLAMAMEALALARQAFGDLSPMAFQRADAMLRMWAGFPLPLPLGALALAGKLDLLPDLEAVQAGGAMAGCMAGAFATPFSMPKLAILPFLSAMLAVQGAMGLALDMPALDQCAACPCA